MSEELGLRERKKQRTRQVIADTARKMFIEHGFDAVPVAAVARAAEVSEGTVFNYFSTKEDLALQGLQDAEADLLATLRDRPPGESLVSAFARFLGSSRLLTDKDPEFLRNFADGHRMIAASPALQAGEREILARNIAPLAVLIAEDTGASADDLRPWVVAHALIGTHQAIIDYARRHVLAGGDDLPRAVAARCREVLALLEEGLAGYGLRAERVPA
jgi:AcrR family transcriptional regulator